MLKTKTALILTATAVAALGFSFSARAADKNPGGINKSSVTAEFPGMNGIVLRPGQTTQLNWTLGGAGLPYFENSIWGECELFFSADAGTTWSRISPQLSVSRKNFDWVVSTTVTKQALIAIQIGIEGQADYHFFRSPQFAILPDKVASAMVEVSTVDRSATGSNVTARWTSNVEDAVSYEVLVSSDRGAHFFTVGETRGTEFSYAVPANYQGGLSFQIVAHRPDGSSVKSALTAESIIKIDNVQN